MKAYVVSSDEDSTVIFAGHSATARSKGAAELGTSFGAVVCSRIPWADHFAPGPIPLLTAIEEGWWINCGYCNTFITKGERIASCNVEAEFAPVEDGQTLYCCPQCRAMAWAKAQHQQDQLHAQIEAVTILWPTATNICAYDLDRVQFSLPGLKHPVVWRPGSPTCDVFAADLSPFMALYSTPEIKQ